HCVMSVSYSRCSPTVYALLGYHSRSTPYVIPAYDDPLGFSPLFRRHRIVQADRKNVVSTAMVNTTASHRAKPTRWYKSTVWENDTLTTQRKITTPRKIDHARILITSVASFPLFSLRGGGWSPLPSLS